MKSIRQKILSFTYLILFILFFLTLHSCKDDPVSIKPNPEDTTDVYDWTIDTIYGYNCQNLYSADSDNIFISARPKPLHYNGQTYEPIDLLDPTFNSDNVAGSDKNNLFFGGSKEGTYYGDPVLKKWSYGAVNSYTLTGDSGVAVADIFVEGPEQCWLSTKERYKLYHLENGILTPYQLDSGCKGSYFFKDQLNNLFAFPILPLSMYDREIRYYKFTNGSFQLIGRDTITQQSELWYIYQRCGKDILRQGQHGVYFFNGSNWEKVCSTEDFKPFWLAGTSKDNFVCYGETSSGSWEIYTWNGVRWKRERNKYIFRLFANIDVSSTSTTIDMLLGIDLNYLLRGKLKKQSMK